MSNGTPSSLLCLNFTAPYLKAAVYGRAAAGTLSCVVCIATVTLIVVLKSYHRFVHRLSLYMAIAGFFFALVMALQGLPVNLDSDVVSLRPGWKSICIIIGFLAQYTGWVQIVLIAWVSPYAFDLSKHNGSGLVRNSEMACIVVCAALPLFISLFPFIDGMYGLVGAWCWIKATRDHSCHESSTGVGFQIGLFYAPVMLLVLLNLCMIVVVLFSFCTMFMPNHQSKRNRRLWDNSKEQHKRAIVLLIYPAFYSIGRIFEIASQIYYLGNTLQNNLRPSSWLLIMHAILPPLIPVVVPFSFVLQPDILGKMKCRKVQDTDEYIELREVSKYSGTHDTTNPSPSSANQFTCMEDVVCSDHEQMHLVVRTETVELQRS